MCEYNLLMFVYFLIHLQVFNEARRNVPSVIYIPSIDQLWSLISDTVRAIFIAQLNQLDPNIPVLLLATADTIFNNLPEQVSKNMKSNRFWDALKHVSVSVLS